MPEDFQSPDIDFIVAGEGVSIFSEIIARLENGLDVTGIPGSVRLENGAVLIKQGEDGIDLDAFPFPRRDLTSKYRKYYGSEWMRPLASIRTSKGCHFRCRFCALWKLAGGRYLVRKPERIVEELKTIREKYVFFSDDESLLDVRRMEKLADMIEQEGIRKRYFLYGRSDTVSRNPGLIEKWKKIGLERVFVGLEFFRDDDLKLIKKGSSVENNIKAVQVLKGLGLDIFPMFIVRPDFTKKDFDDLRKFCLSLDLDFIGFSVLTPLPGTDLYGEVKDDLITSNYDYFDFFHTHLRTTLPLKDFYKELIRLYNRSRSIRGQLRFLRKFPLRELPAAFKVFSRFLKRLKQLEADY